jgi:hypothetical protein
VIDGSRVTDGSSGEARELDRGIVAALWLGDMLSNGRASGGGCDPGPWPPSVGTGSGSDTRGVPLLLVPVEGSLLRLGMALTPSLVSVVSEPPEVDAAASYEDS